MPTPALSNSWISLGTLPLFPTVLPLSPASLATG